MSEIIEGKSLNKLFGCEFELLDTGFATGAANMCFDIERTELLSHGKTLPMFRLYGWEPWAVSLGANQQESDINKTECSARGFDIVRRPTGGRAVLHANEITYSVVLQLPDTMTVHDVYKEIHSVLLTGLQGLGIEGLSFSKAQPDFREFYKREEMSVSCFASVARFEIEYEGRKVVGSAQRLFGRTLLQHGSILIGAGHEQLAYVSNNSSEEAKQKLLNFTLAHSATLSQAAVREISYRESAESIVNVLKK